MVAVVAGPALKGGGKVDRGDGQRDQVADCGDDLGEGVHRLRSDR
ncbi:hypothetical protein ACFQS1_38240 [Paractinoplanes rhizophilus]|uniref:Uncharacterized protein n=1 Tax=Paractinoplanes rhizophilus TaxID=1416877 RepID=A0ABW2I4W0_9ACTN